MLCVILRCHIPAVQGWEGRGPAKEEEFVLADGSAIQQKRLRPIQGAALALLSGANAEQRLWRCCE